MKSKILFHLGLFLFVLFFFAVSIAPIHAASPAIVVREDGLTVVTPETVEPRAKLDYLTMIVKTGYGHDPKGKSGLTDLTNTLMYLIFYYNTHAANTSFETQGDYTTFTFSVASKDMKLLYNELDEIIRTEALFGYDYCNAWIEYIKNSPRHPGLPALTNLASMLYGPDHPYTKMYNPDYANLNVGELNKWFRKVYRPNNIIISATTSPPEEFLRRPSGKEFKEPVGLPKIASPLFEAKADLKYVKDHDNSSVVCMGFPAPKLNENEYLSMQLGWIYLEEAMNEELREKSGFVYYISPTCSSREQPSAPVFTILFQTLPEDTGIATQKAIDVLKSLAKNGIPKDDLERIMASEKKRLALRDKSPAALTQSYAFRALYNVNWIGDSEEYLNQLEKSSQGVAKVFADRLPSLKISIAGPEGVEETLKVVSFRDLEAK